MDDEDDPLDPLDIPPPESWLTPENVERAFKESEEDIAAGRLIPLEDVLEMLKHYEEKAHAVAAARTAAE